MFFRTAAAHAITTAAGGRQLLAGHEHTTPTPLTPAYVDKSRSGRSISPYTSNPGHAGSRSGVKCDAYGSVQFYRHLQHAVTQMCTTMIIDTNLCIGTLLDINFSLHMTVQSTVTGQTAVLLKRCLTILEGFTVCERCSLVLSVATSHRSVISKIAEAAPGSAGAIRPGSHLQKHESRIHSTSMWTTTLKDYRLTRFT